MGDSIAERLRKLREKEEGRILGPAEPLLRPPDTRPRELKSVGVELQEVVMDASEESGFRVDLVRATAIANTRTDAFSWLVMGGKLKRGNEAQSTADIRLVAAHRYQMLHEGAQVSPIQGRGFEIRVASSSSTGRTVGDQAIDCMRKLGRIDEFVGDRAIMRALQLVLLRDVEIWKGLRGQAARREIERFLEGLDYLSAFFGYISRREVLLRWGR